MRLLALLVELKMLIVLVEGRGRRPNHVLSHEVR